MQDYMVVELAKVAFEVYWYRDGCPTLDGRKMPGWDDISEDVQNSWIAAVEKVLRIINLR